MFCQKLNLIDYKKEYVAWNCILIALSFIYGYPPNSLNPSSKGIFLIMTVLNLITYNHSIFLLYFTSSSIIKCTLFCFVLE